MKSRRKTKPKRHLRIPISIEGRFSDPGVEVESLRAQLEVYTHTLAENWKKVGGTHSGSRYYHSDLPGLMADDRQCWKHLVCKLKEERDAAYTAIRIHATLYSALPENQARKQEEANFLRLPAVSYEPGKYSGPHPLNPWGGKDYYKSVAAGMEKRLAKPKANETASDVINHPPHYTHGRLEPIDVIEDWKLGFHLGNALKYIARADHKGNREQDLNKAIWYLQRALGGKV